MSEYNKWKKVKKHQGTETIELGPNYTYNLLEYPRHMLFTFSRYKFAAKLIGEKPKVKILEFGCSEGIPCLMLAEFGHEVVAVDNDEDAISWARANLKKYNNNITFKFEDFIGKYYGKFDVVVSLDVVEHIPKEQEIKFFQTVLKNLKEWGYCIIGTPNISASKYSSKSSQIGHVNLYSAERLRDTLKKYFKSVFIFGMNDEVIHTGFYPMSHYLFGLGVHPNQSKK